MPRLLNSRQIEAFRAVMLTGTTTMAATMLHTTQPSISRLLAQVQAATQLKLFDLQKGRLRPTQEARQLFETVQRHFLGIERIEQDIAIMRKSGTGTLRIGCTPALGLSVMPKVIRSFNARHPEVHLNLQTIGAHHLQEGLLHGLYDLVLSTTPISHPHLSSKILHRSSAVCVLHPAHALATRKAIHVRDLCGQVLLNLNTGDEIHQQFQHTMELHAVEVSAAVETTYSVTICTLAAEGVGIGIVNPYVASVFAQALKALPLSPRLPVQVCMALASQFAPSLMTEEFAALLQDYFSKLAR